jgi:hypothetical protein
MPRGRLLGERRGRSPSSLDAGRLGEGPRRVAPVRHAPHRRRARRHGQGAPRAGSPRGERPPPRVGGALPLRLRVGHGRRRARRSRGKDDLLEPGRSRDLRIHGRRGARAEALDAHARPLSRAPRGGLAPSPRGTREPDPRPDRRDVRAPEERRGVPDRAGGRHLGDGPRALLQRRHPGHHAPETRRGETPSLQRGAARALRPHRGDPGGGAHHDRERAARRAGSGADRAPARHRMAREAPAREAHGTGEAREPAPTNGADRGRDDLRGPPDLRGAASRHARRARSRGHGGLAGPGVHGTDGCRVRSRVLDRGHAGLAGARDGALPGIAGVPHEHRTSRPRVPHRGIAHADRERDRAAGSRRRTRDPRGSGPEPARARDPRHEGALPIARRRAHDRRPVRRRHPVTARVPMGAAPGSTVVSERAAGGPDAGAPTVPTHPIPEEVSS